MGLPGIILKREFVHLFLPSVCAAACVHPFIDWNPGFELPCKWFFFECALATPSHTPPPSRTPSSSSRAPSAPYTYVREDTFSFPVLVSLQLVSSVTLSTSIFVALSGRMVQRAPWAANTRPPSPRPTQKEFKTGARTRRCAARWRGDELTKKRLEAVSSWFSLPLGLVLPESRFPKYRGRPRSPSAGVATSLRGGSITQGMLMIPACPSFFFSSNFLNCLGLIC